MLVGLLTQDLRRPLYRLSETLKKLRAITGYNDQDVTFVDEVAQFYRFDGDSTATHDNDEVVRPGDVAFGSPGRWLKVEFGGGGLTQEVADGLYDSLGSAAAAIAAHVAASDPHPTYLKQAEADALYDPLGEAAAEVAAHVAAGDPHLQYHTDARALTWLGGRSTSDLPEGANLYYTAARFNTAFSGKTTDDLSEGGSNLYYTAARFAAAFLLSSIFNLADVPAAAGEAGNSLRVNGAENAMEYFTALETVPFGRSLYVDIDTGDDGTGTRGDISKPYATVNAAHAAASAGDQIFCGPGTHELTAALTISNNISLIGCGQGVTFIKMTNVTADTNLLTISNGSGVALIRDLTLHLTSAQHHTLRALYATGIGYVLQNCEVFCENPSAGAGSSDIYGFETTVGPAAHPNYNLINCKVRSRGTGGGNSRGAYVNTAAAGFVAKGTSFQGTLTSGAGTAIGVENNQSGVVTLENCTASGGSVGTCSDVSETAGEIVLDNTRLINNDPNDKAVSLKGGFQLIYSVTGTVASNATRFLVAGSGASLVNEQKIRFKRPTVVQNLSLRAVTGPAATKTLTVTVRKNGGDTALAASMGAGVTAASDLVDAIPYTIDDDFSMKIVTDTNNNAVDVTAMVECYSN